MVTPEEMKKYDLDAFKEGQKEETAYKVTMIEMAKYDNDILDLADMIGERKRQFQRENNLNSTMAYGELEDLCQISADTIKKTISSTTKLTRNFLYKFSVGLKMDINEANKYFEKCGGVLNEASAADKICMKAIEDHDTVESMIEEFQKYLNLNISMKNRRGK